MASCEAKSQPIFRCSVVCGVPVIPASECDSVRCFVQSHTASLPSVVTSKRITLRQPVIRFSIVNRWRHDLRQPSSSHGIAQGMGKAPSAYSHRTFAGVLPASALDYLLQGSIVCQPLPTVGVLLSRSHCDSRLVPCQYQSNSSWESAFLSPLLGGYSEFRSPNLAAQVPNRKARVPAPRAVARTNESRCSLA